MITLLLAVLLCLSLVPSHAFSTRQLFSTTATTATATTTPSNLVPTATATQLQMGLVDGVGDFFKRFTTKATASHILIKGGGAETQHKLEDLKVQIGDSPVKFAEAAATYSQCPSASSGGSLGEFGPGAMVKEFDAVVFNQEVGKVHGPIKTQFGYHLIYINDRTE